ncbi:transcription factor RFX4-like isoform X2 [Oscarella lobularis]|uniref:transcription factor RFX4-like isoform X2 n=1 Tax=Oscarella lobularis TaxID=121494 RepID=UPI003314244D
MQTASDDEYDPAKDDSIKDKIVIPSSRHQSKTALQRGIKSRNAKLTLKWLEENYEETEGVCLPRSVLYTHYLDFFKRQNLTPVSAASFGKVIRQKFPNLTTRRLGTRGQSKYHYYGIGIKKTSPYFSSVYTKKGLTRFSKGAAKQEGNSLYSTTSCSGTLLPDFPSVNEFNFPEGVSLSKVETFLMMYRTHCQRIVDTIVRANFAEIHDFLLHFWQAMPSHMMSVLSCDAVVDLIAVCDVALNKTLTSVLIPATLQPLPDTLSQEIKLITEEWISWLSVAMRGIPENLRQQKLKLAESFCQSLKRQTSLIHFAQAAKGVLRSSDMVSHMLVDWRGIDFPSVRTQMTFSIIDNPKGTAEFIDAVGCEFEQLFIKQATLEIYFEWLDSLVQEKVVEKAGESSGTSFSDESKRFMKRWVYFGELVVKELTLHSAPSFGSFHLLYLTLLEYVTYLLESLGDQKSHDSALGALAKYKKNQIARQQPMFVSVSDSTLQPLQQIQPYSNSGSLSLPFAPSDQMSLVQPRQPLYQSNQQSYVMGGYSESSAVQTAPVSAYPYQHSAYPGGLTGGFQDYASGMSGPAGTMGVVPVDQCLMSYSRQDRDLFSVLA